MMCNKHTTFWKAQQRSAALYTACALCELYAARTMLGRNLRGFKRKPYFCEINKNRFWQFWLMRGQKKKSSTLVSLCLCDNIKLINKL